MCSHSIFPPTSAALKNHLKRANYQVHIWKRALEPQTPDEGPEDQGWKLSDGRLEIVWTDLAPSPEAVMELVFCVVAEFAKQDVVLVSAMVYLALKRAHPLINTPTV